jgi:tetratricopeptide (TPR) repeat protein
LRPLTLILFTIFLLLSGYLYYLRTERAEDRSIPSGEELVISDDRFSRIDPAGSSEDLPDSSLSEEAGGSAPPEEEKVPSEEDGELKRAFLLLKEGKPRDALPIFLSLDPGDQRAALGAGVSLYRLGRYEEAVDTLEVLKGAGIADFVVLKLLAFSYYNLNRLQESREYAEEALTLKKDEELTALLNRVSREIRQQENFQEEISGHFILHFDGYRHGGISRSVLGILEDAYRDIGRELNLFPDTPINVILYTSREFRDVTQVPEWAGGIYDGKIRLPVKNAEERPELFRTVLYHEYTHALVFTLTGGRVPLWLNEGLAEYFSRDYPVQTGQVIPLQRLETSFNGLSRRQVPLAYHESYSAVRHLIDRYGLYYLKDILERVGEGENFRNAFFSVFGMEYDSFLKTWGR